MTTSCSHASSKAKKSTYDIRQPANGKYHAIVKVSHDKGTCSGFVISDDYILTAGHCMKITNHFMKNDYIENMEGSKKKVKQLKKLQDYTRKYCLNLPIICERMVADVQFRIDAELDAREEAKKFKVTKFKVYDINGKDTNTEGVAQYKSDRRDFGYIKGDFRKFNKLKIKHDFDMKPGDTFRICGFPSGTPPAICTDFKYEYLSNFKFGGESLFVPGMSGGPAIDHSGEVVGIIVHVNGTKYFLEQAIGLD